MKLPVPYTSQAIRHQIAALDVLIRQQNARRDALRMGTRTPHSEQELNRIEREIDRLWQGKDYWKNQLDARLAWERAIQGTPEPAPKELPRGPAPVPPPPSPFEKMPRKPRKLARSRVPYFPPPFPIEPYPTPARATAEEKRCIAEWNSWREKAAIRWHRWMIELERWDQDMLYWDRLQAQRLKNQEALTKPPSRPEANLPVPPTCSLPDYDVPI